MVFVVNVCCAFEPPPRSWRARHRVRTVAQGQRTTSTLVESTRLATVAEPTARAATRRTGDL